MNKFLLFALISFTINFATEERNPHPFYKISSTNLEIILEHLNASLCLIHSEDVFDYTLAKPESCETLKENVWLSLDKIIKANPKKKEFIFQFFDRNNSKMKAQFSDEKKEYDLISVIYYKKEKIIYLELLDQEKNYYFFQVNPKKIRYKVKIL